MPSLADLFTSEAGAFVRQEEEEEEEEDDVKVNEISSLEQSYPPGSENLTPELRNITEETLSEHDLNSYELYSQDIYPLIPPSEDPSSEEPISTSTSSISSSELEELTNSLTRAGEIVAAAVRSVRSLVTTALQVNLASLSTFDYPQSLSSSWLDQWTCSRCLPDHFRPHSGTV